jgi:hypothetical protein
MSLADKTLIKLRETNISQNAVQDILTASGESNQQ